MTGSALLNRPEIIVYPDCDGEPMSDNTKQLRWIVVLYGNLSAQFQPRDDVFVGGNLLWYAVEGAPEVRQAPDVLVVFGRPKGDRGSYQQWKEGNVPLTVVFEVLSPGNTVNQMADKHAFYEDHGVEEYYVYDPDANRLHAYVRRGDVLLRVRQLNGFVSPRLGIRFELTPTEMIVYGPDGRRFLTFEEMVADRNQAQERADQAQQQADQAQQQADQAQQRADQAQQQADQAQQQADQAQQRAELAEQRSARLAELSRKARHQQATLEELQELERLEGEASAPP